MHTHRQAAFPVAQGAAAAACGILRRRGWLSTVPTDMQQAILAKGQIQGISTGSIFNVAGDTEVGIWGLISGQLAVTSALNGAEAPMALLNHPGHWGGMAPLFGKPRLANVSALIPSTVLFVSLSKLRQMLNESPSWWEYFGLLVYDHAITYGQLSVDLLLPRSTARTAAILLHQAGLRNTGDGPVRVFLTQEELGAMANLTRQPIGRILREFEAAGLIALDYHQIMIEDPASLRAVANAPQARSAVDLHHRLASPTQPIADHVRGRLPHET